jgi:hypothetical protein
MTMDPEWSPGPATPSQVQECPERVARSLQSCASPSGQTAGHGGPEWPSPMATDTRGALIGSYLSRSDGLRHLIGVSLGPYTAARQQCRP